MANEEIKEAIIAYAKGNPGVIKVLMQQVQIHNLVTAQQLEELIGWPLSDHTVEKTQDIWDKFNGR